MSDETPKEESKEEKAPEVKAEPKAEQSETEAPANDVKEQVEESVAEVSKAPELRPGYKVRVHQKIQQGDKERVQVFEGVIIAMGGQDAVSRTMTVRKIAEDGVGVERIWPVMSPMIQKIEVVERPKVRRSKLYYLRNSLRKFKKLRERS